MTAAARLAVAASAQHPDLRPDWPLLREALARVGITATTEVWTDPSANWSEYDLVVANGAWDNIHRPEEFLAWADRTAALVPMVNPPATLRWGMDKHYLAALAAAGVATVPTTWLGPAEARTSDDVTLPDGDVVVKPTISGGGFDTARYRPSEGAAARAHVRAVIGAGRGAMVQPYLGAVDTEGEGGLIFLGGRFSHAFRKGPLLREGVGPQPHLWQHEQISALRPTSDQLAAAQTALAVAEHLLGPTTYARADMVTLADGTPGILELELVDPALYFEVQPAAATRFAEVLARLVGSVAR